jgi:Autographiviridae endonuclease VII
MKIGICGCGCGRKTDLAPATRPRRNWIKGQPKPFLPHHSKFRNVSRDGTWKKCAQCSAWKKVHDFHRFEASPDGRQRICKECSAKHAKAYRNTPNGRAARRNAARTFILRSNYGLTKEAYMAMHDAQGGLCAICGNPEWTMRLGTPRRLGADHDHRTNKVRELLCIPCNQGIARFHDKPELLEAAAAYLRKHGKA